jgi:hypothetical protein
VQIPYNGHIITRKLNPAAGAGKGDPERYLYVVQSALTQQKLGIYRSLDAAVSAIDRAGVLVH